MRISNDSDGLIDMDDPGCPNQWGMTESPECNDGIDNDGDTLADLSDPNCLWDWGDDETWVFVARCGLGVELALVLPLLLWLPRRRRRFSTFAPRGAKPFTQTASMGV